VGEVSQKQNKCKNSTTPPDNGQWVNERSVKILPKSYLCAICEKAEDKGLRVLDALLHLNLEPIWIQ